MGTYLLQGLANLRNKFEVVGDVRGKGLMIGVEMVNDCKNFTPLENSKVLKIWEKCRDLGLLIGKGGYNGNVNF